MTKKDLRYAFVFLSLHAEAKLIYATPQPCHFFDATGKIVATWPSSVLVYNSLPVIPRARTLIFNAVLACPRQFWQYRDHLGALTYHPLPSWCEPFLAQNGDSVHNGQDAPNVDKVIRAVLSTNTFILSLADGRTQKPGTYVPQPKYTLSDDKEALKALEIIKRAYPRQVDAAAAIGMSRTAYRATFLNRERKMTQKMRDNLLQAAREC